MLSIIRPLTEEYSKLKKGDVLLSQDSVPISCNGTIKYRNYERISFQHLSRCKFVGETTKFEILRDGKKMEVCVKLSLTPQLVAKHLYYEKYPTYFIAQGFVFTKLSRPFLSDTFGVAWSKNCPLELAELAIRGQKEEEDQEIVVLGY